MNQYFINTLTMAFSKWMLAFTIEHPLDFYIRFEFFNFYSTCNSIPTATDTDSIQTGFCIDTLQWMMSKPSK